MKYTTLALFLFTMSYNLNAQTETYETFDFIYIDNSQTTAEDGLSQQQINFIEARAAEIAERDGHLLIMYASNANNPKISTDPKNVSTWLNNLLQNDAPFPGDKFAEKKLVREALYSSIFELDFKGNATANIYINNKQARKLDISQIQKTLEYKNPDNELNVNVAYKVIDLKL